MKIKITGLLDSYYDNSVSLETPPAFEPHPIQRSNGRFSMKKPIMLAASLVLVLCGTFLLYLGFPAADEGKAMAEGSSVPPEVSMESTTEFTDSLEESTEAPEDIPPDEPTEKEESFDSALDFQPNEDAFSGNIILPEDDSIQLDPAYDSDGDGILTANLDISFEFDGQLGSLVKLTLDPSTGYIRWYQRHPYSTTELWGEATSIALDNYILQQYQSEAYLVFTDGTEIMIGCGDNIGFSEDMYWSETRLYWLAGDYDLDLENKTPAYLRIADTTYDFS